MKPPLIQRLKARLLVSGHKKQQGVAILTVLAIITLMTVLVVSFFNMARSAQTTAKGSVEIQRVSTLKDTVINLVIAQFREASRLAPSDPQKPREIVTWTSQPGAIRTYSSTDISRNKVFKLYSSNVPQLADVGPGQSTALLKLINDDIVPDWGERPDEFTDLNRPVYTAATGDRASASGAKDDEGYSYPIADPRAYNGKPGDNMVNTEGFRYSNQSLNKTLRGVDAQKGQLAMPVRWIYQLQDGTMGYLNDTREFTSLSGKDGGDISKSNPIVGRMAWWADDESCKINVNTASVPAIWDIPRTTSREDVWLANTQPLAGEYQRYPGHPATVDLCAVLFPGRRYAGTDGSTWTMPIGEHMPLRLSDAEANLIWDLAPFIVANTSGGQAGTAGGTRPTPVGGTTVTFEGDDHLFTSLDEVYFKASAAKNPSLDTARENLSTQNKDPKGELLRRLERGQFFLTHKSHSPEVTNTGFPRVSMYPMDTAASPYVNSTTSGKPPNTVSPYDITMAVNSTIGKRAYYFQRHDPTSRHNEFYNTSGATDVTRDQNVFKYVKELSRLPIAGYPQGFAGSQPFPLGLKEDPSGTSLASKYPAGFNPVTNTRYKDSNLNVQNGQTLMDATDRTQILLNMIDYTRSLNMQPVFIEPGARYDGGNGQATGICGCGNNWAVDHGNALMYSNNNYRAPKGAGKLVAPSEIAMIVNIAGTKSGTAVTGDWNTLLPLIPAGPSRNVAMDNDSGGARYMLEVGFVMAGFNPKLGWAPVQPNVGMYISTAVSTPENPVSKPPGALATDMKNGNVLPLHISVDGSQEESLRICVNPLGSSGSNSTRKTPAGLIPYGGMQGPRVGLSTGGSAPGNFNMAICAPICLRQGDAPAGSVSVNLQVDPSVVVRVLMVDGAADPSNVTTAVDLRLPADFGTNLQVPVTNKSLSKQALEFTAALPGTANAFPGKCPIRSLVLPHGDYRLATGIRADADMFVAHSGYAGSGRSYSFYESTEDPNTRKMVNSQFSPITIINSKEVKKYITPGSNKPMTSLPLPLADPADMAIKENSVLTGTGTATVTSKDTPKQVDADILKFASMDPDRRSVFAFGRRDGRGVLAKRGSSDPDETGDFDNGTGAAEDGPYMNHPDEGDRRKGGVRYFTKLTAPRSANDEKSAQNISPNFLIRSPVDFGSIPSGLQARVPWQTLRFRPDPGMNDPLLTMTGPNSTPPRGRPFANFCGPRDHFFLDMFWMPVVEPYSISEPFSTKGTINLNQQIFPFMYIERTTALHALLRGERMLAIPNEAAEKYKKVTSTGAPDNDDPTYRHFLNVDETVRQFTQRYNTGTDPEGFNLAFNTFRSASEICEVWLVPDKNGSTYDGATQWDLPWTIGQVTATGRQGFWEEHRLTGDNSRERPYANLYPRVTVRSNVFKLHIVAQTLQKARSTDEKSFDSIEDLVTAEWRGSCLIERSADSRDPSLNGIDYTTLNSDTIRLPRVENYYTYRVTEVKQLTQ